MVQTSPFIPTGWKCPCCNRVFSPTTVMCSFCPGTMATTYPGITWIPTGTTDSPLNEQLKVKIGDLTTTTTTHAYPQEPWTIVK